MTAPKTHMVVDTANIFWRSVAAARGQHVGDVRDQVALGLHGCLMSLRKHWHAVRPDRLAVTFEGKDNWRKEYTRSEACVSKRVYKANRVADPSMAILADVLRVFEDMVRTHTGLTVLSHPRLEGDDLAAGYVQKYAPAGDRVVILSGDKDFVQLLKYPNVTIRNPDGGGARTLMETCEVDDAGYFMFEKCFRGDSGDNVISALPRVRKTRLLKAWSDDYELANLMNSTWDFVDTETGEKRVMSTRALFEENCLLMDLEAQPVEVRAQIEQTVDEAPGRAGKFSLFHFQRWCAQHDLQQVGERVMDFVEMLAQQR